MKSMFKNLCLAAFLTLLALPMMAQLGVKAGVNFSSLAFFDDNPLDINQEFITGYQVGLVYHIGIGDKLALQPEAAFYTRGGRAEIGGA